MSTKKIDKRQDDLLMERLRRRTLRSIGLFDGMGNHAAAVPCYRADAVLQILAENGENTGASNSWF